MEASSLMASKVVVITGASDGMGKSIAFEFAQAGYSLAICARNSNRLNQIREELLQLYPRTRVLAVPTDCSVKEDIQDFAQKVVAEFEEVDVLINNVGQYKMDSLLNEPDHFMEDLFKINFYSAYYLSKFFGKRMADRKMGHILNVISVAGIEPILGAGAYSISKFALLGLTKNLRLELNPFQVKVTSIIPGSTLTGSWGGMSINPETLINAKDISKLVLTCVNLSFGANVEEIIVRPL